ncbi:MAG: choice-of-anchor I family protein [Pseudomonadota bacterium]|nr:choice-of-anchor I family protein [Pseudomonadota bacterium]
MLSKQLGVLAIATVIAVMAGCDGDDGRDGDPGQSELTLDLSLVGRYASGAFDEGAAEIVAFDASTKRLFVVNAAATTVDVLNVADPSAPALLETIDASADGDGANSVDVFGGVLAVAIQADPKTDPGKVVFYDTTTLAKIGEAEVGALPDMLTFTPDGKAVLVANEGEASEGYEVDPVGSVSVIDVSGGFAAPVVATAGFARFNADAAELREAGVRIYGPGATVAQDLEPEYIAVAKDGQSAWVTLQEANAIGLLDLSDIGAPEISKIIPMGYKNHGVLGNELDVSDRDGGINIRNWPLLGMYQPDTVASYTFNSRNYFVTANEGDDRNDFIPGEETARIKDLVLDPEAFPDAVSLQADEALGRLEVTTYTGDTDGDGDFDALYSLGSRSFSIWSEDGAQLFDSGSEIERIVAQRYPDNFNASHDENDAEGRSDAKGPEPEGLTVGQIGGRTFAFVGLERISGIMVYDITNPQRARFVQYINSRDFSRTPGDDPDAGDLGPEGLEFIAAEDSPIGVPMLMVGNEVSGTSALYRIDVIETD